MGFTLPPGSRFLFGFKRLIHTDSRADCERSLCHTIAMTFKYSGTILQRYSDEGNFALFLKLSDF